MTQTREVVLHSPCPADRGGRVVTIDLTAILRAEARQEEVAFVTKMKAPELLATFNKSWLTLSENIAALRRQLVLAKKAVESRKGVIILDQLACILKEKGLGNSEAVREAVFSQDEVVKERVEVVEKLEAMIELLKVKAQAFHNAYTSVKKILGESDVMGARPAPDDSAPPGGWGFGSSNGD